MIPAPEVQIDYAREARIGVEEYRQVLLESGLSRIRPVNDDARLAAIIEGSNLIVTARRAGTLVGFARGVTDSSWVCYLADLAVSHSVQGLGVGRGLMDESYRQLGDGIGVILASVPEAVGFYEKAGMERIPNVFWHHRRF